MAEEIAPDPQIITHQLGLDGPFPNHPHWPLMIYKQAIQPASGEMAELMEQVFEANDWGGAWRNGVFSFQHFHSNAHEVLGVCGGSAKIQFGGPNGPVVSVEAGDVAILPAGTAHCNVGSDRGFRVIGAYPAGQDDYDMCRGDPGELHQVQANIAPVPRPATDPVYGKAGPLFSYW